MGEASEKEKSSRPFIFCRNSYRTHTI